MAEVIHIKGDDHFKKEVLEFKGIAILDFWAEWCGPCRMLGPIMEELADHYDTKEVKIIKVDIQDTDNEAIAQKFQVISIPAVFILKDGEVKDNLVGVNPKDVYVNKIDTMIAGDVNKN